MASVPVCSVALLISLVLCVGAFNRDARIPEDPFFFTGTDHSTLYNDAAGTNSLFPDARNFDRHDLVFFSDRMDFETFEDRLLIGAADKLYLLNSGLAVADEFYWPSDDNLRLACEARPSIDRDYVCRNHIRLYHKLPTEEDQLYICGSQAAAPASQCRAVDMSGNALGEATPATTTTSSLVSTDPDYPSLGQFRNLNSTDSAFISWNYDLVGSNALYNFDMHQINFNETEETFTNPVLFGTSENWLDTPVYVVDMFPMLYGNLVANSPGTNYNFYYVFLRERHQFSLEQSLDTEPLVLSRVLRICVDDPGVLLTDGTTQAFSTLLKTRIFCDQEAPSLLNDPLGSVDMRYNDLWSVSLNSQSGGRVYPSQSYDTRLYAAFSGPLSGPPGSAICVYATTPSAGGTSNFNRGLFDTFLDDIIVRDSPQEVENFYPGCNGEGRPATTNTNRVTAEDIVVSSTMEQIGENPLVVFDSIYITQITVDEVCVVSEVDRTMCHNQDVLFLATSLGTIRKVVFTESVGLPYTPILAEEITLGDDSYIKDIKVKDLSDGKHLFVTTTSRVYKLSLERCARHVGPIACLESRDPYCVWNTQVGLCQATTLSARDSTAGRVPPYLLQNIHFGYVPDLIRAGLERHTYSVNEGVGMLAVTVISNDTVPDAWLELVVLEPETNAEVSAVGVTFSGSLSTTVPVSIPADSTYTGVRRFNITLRNTNRGSVIFTTQQATVTIIDDDGLLAQFGIGGLEGDCTQWKSEGYSLSSIDEAIEDWLVQYRITVSPNELACSTSQALINSAVYRVTLIPAAPNIDISQVQQTLSEWVSMQNMITLIQQSGEKGPMIKIDASCSTEILTLEDDLCTFQQVTPGGLGSQTGSSLSAGGVVSVILAIVLVVLVAVVIVLAVVLYRAKKGNSGSMDIESEVAGGKTTEGGGEYSGNKISPDVQKCLEASHNSNTNSNTSTSPPTSPVPQEPDSAAPLVHNGVESKKNMFPFTLGNPPISRRDSPKLRSSVLSDANVVMESPKGKPPNVSVFSESAGSGRGSVFSDSNANNNCAGEDSGMHSVDTKV